MFVAAMLAYYFLAFALIYGVGYYTFRQNERRAQERHNRHLANLQKEFDKLSPLPSIEPPLVPDLPPPPELRLAIARPAGAGAEQLTRLAAEVIRQANRLEQQFGGDGLDYDPDGSVEEPGRLVLRLVARSADWGAAERLEAVARELTQLAKRDAAPGDADLRARIDRELRPHLSPEAAEHVAGAVVC